VKANINPQLEPLCVPLASLHEDQRNAKKHTPKNLTRIKRSLRKFGMQKPIVVVKCRCHLLAGEHAFILAGNGTYRCAKQLGWDRLPRVEFEDAARARAYALADNRSSEGGGWNKDVLEELLAELDEQLPDFDPGDVGFEDLFDSKDDPGKALGALTYSVIADFDNETDQAQLLTELEARGLRCRLLIA